MRNALQFLVVLFASLSAPAQVLTLTGHIVAVDSPRGEPAFCGCAVGDSVTARIGLQTFFYTYFDGPGGSAAVFPLASLPKYPDLGIPRSEFLGNSFSLQIGRHYWFNDFTPPEDEHGPSGDIQLSKPGVRQTSQVFTNAFTTGFYVKSDTNQDGGVVLDVNTASSLPLWNTTGEKVASGIARPNSYIGLTEGKYGGRSVRIAVDAISADTSRASALDPNVLRLQAEHDKRSSGSQTASTPPYSPFLPPSGNSGAAPARALMQTPPINPCLNTVKTVTGIVTANEVVAFGMRRNAIAFFAGSDLYGMTETLAEADARRALMLAGMATVGIECVIAPAVQAMASEAGRGQNGGALITGGNTIPKSVADQLNKRFGKNLLPREWGRALEALKKYEGLANNFHGKLLANGDFIDPNSGQNFGNIEEYLP